VRELVRKAGIRDLSRKIPVLVCLFVPCLAFAGKVRGTVVNGTTGKPAVGDNVVILRLSPEGMTEEGRVKTDRTGRFALSFSDTERHLLRVVHQGVTYHERIGAGTNPFVMRVYDVAAALDGITAVMDVQRFEATKDILEVKHLVTVRNASKPARTLMNDRPFEFRLPFDAQVQSGMVQVEDHQPLKQDPVPSEQSGQYYFNAPIRPGDTRFAVIYRIHYKGSAMIKPQIRNPQERFVVMLPKTMKFEPLTASIFQPMPGTTPDNVQATGPVSADAVVAFNVSGTGTLEELKGRREEDQKATKTEMPRPGGGLGPPIDAPDPLHKHRWLILGGISVLIGLGASRAVRRSSRLARLRKHYQNQTSERARDPEILIRTLACRGSDQSAVVQFQQSSLVRRLTTKLWTRLRRTLISSAKTTFPSHVPF
jgi:hypothetical protein